MIMKDKHILIKRDDNDYHLDLYQDNYETWKLSHVYDLEMHIRRLRKTNCSYRIQTEEQLKDSSPSIHIMVKVLELLESTTCGCCDSPWLHSETFNQLAELFRKFEGVIENAEN